MTNSEFPEWHNAVLAMEEMPGPMSFMCEPQVRRNIVRYAAMAASHDAVIMPHFKGHRILAVAQHQLDAGSPAIQVSTMTDIIQAYRSGLDCPYVLAWCWDRETTWHAAAAIVAEGATLSVDVDSVELAEGYAAAAAKAGVVLGARVQVDTGLRGIEPTKVASLARRIMSMPALQLTALTTYRGVYNRDLSYSNRPLGVLGREEAELVAGLAQELANDVEGLQMIAGSSLTASGAAAVAGITGVGCGSYAIGDLTQSMLGQCDRNEIAFASLVTVIATNGETGTINAGFRHLGVVRDYPTDIPGLQYAATWDAGVGLISTDATTGQVLRRHGPPLTCGQRLLLLPGNARAGAAQPGAVAVVDDEGDITDVWAKQANHLSLADLLI